MSANPRGRPPNPEKRLEIALSALTILRERGMAISMSELAQALGMKRPTLYFYFKDISSILELAITHTMAAEAQHTAAKLAGLEHPIDILETIMLESYAFYEQQGLEDFIQVLCQWTASGEPARQRFSLMVREHQAAIGELMIQTLEIAQADGRVAPCDARALWHLVHMVVDGGMIHQVLTGADPRPVLRLIQHTVLAPLRLTPEDMP